VKLPISRGKLLVATAANAPGLIPRLAASSLQFPWVLGDNRSPIIHGSFGADMVAGSVTDGPVRRRMVGLELGNAATKEGVVWAFPPAMSVSEGDSLGRDGCSRLFSLVSDRLRS
jgi:hypothetical protein